MDNRRNEVLAVAAFFFVFTWLTVSLRCYVRGVLMKTWGMDDSYMVATLGVFTVYLAFQIVAAIHGIGRHRSELSDRDARIALMFWYLCELLYVIANCLLKFAIGHFYLRVAMQRWHIWAIRLLMMGSVLFGLIYFLLVMLQCLPISVFWNEHPASEHCLPKGPTLGITYAFAAVNALADWLFVTLPFFIIWDLDMKLKTKILVASILAFAAIGSTGTVVRMFYIHTLMDGPNFLYATTDVAIWSTVEPGIGIAAGSIACLRPLFRIWLWRLGFAAPPLDRRSRTYYPSSSGQRRKDRRDVPTESNPTEALETKKEVTEWVNAPSTIDVIEPEVELALSKRNMQIVTGHQEHELPPRLELRDSFRNSFGRGSILNLGKFRIPT